jgi:chemotaxis protein methyltransferase CheR
MLYEGEEPVSGLIEVLTIHETYFFRELSSLNAIVSVAKKVLETKSEVKILCAGCSTGEEGYSLAIKLFEEGILSESFSVDCFDISSNAIVVAKKGEYNGRSINRLNKVIIDKYFVKKDNILSVKPFLKKQINFFVYNILDLDELENKYDIILCRNVLLYFSKEKKKLALRLLFDKLNYEGAFFMGKTESIGDIAVEFEKKQMMNTKFYKKRRK